MRINDLFPLREGADAEHAKQLRDTGFWGAQGAGCLFGARHTGRFLVAHRSGVVEQPGTWGTWGGAIDRGEDPMDTVKREAWEETGYTGPVRIEPLYVFTKGDFRYSNFLCVVEDEFNPRLDWENQGFRWCAFGDWPAPMHFGLAALLRDAASEKTLREFAATHGGDSPPKPPLREGRGSVLRTATLLDLHDERDLVDERENLAHRIDSER